MLQLRTFGALDLRATGRPAEKLLAQPRSTALFIYLLLARPRGYMRRDILCALFWPDADEDHARSALSQALTRIRKAVGMDVFQLRGRNELRVAAGLVTCDVAVFEKTVVAGHYAAALDLYAGPFLHGFHAPHMPGFERWAEIERDRLRSLAALAARALAEQQLAAGHVLAAEQAAARALAIAPESEALASELVCELAAAGDRVAAVCLYDAWVETLARDLDLEPSDDVQTLVSHIRCQACAGPTGPVTGAATRESAIPRQRRPAQHRSLL